MIVTIIVSIFGAVPERGGRCRVVLQSGKEFSVAGTLKAVTPQPASIPLQGERRWSQLALIEIEVGAEALPALLPEGHSQQVILTKLDGDTDATVEPLAAGLTIGSSPPLGADVPGRAGRGPTIWLTGLSGAGKTTIALELQRLLKGQRRVEVLDADLVRTHVCKGLGFSEEDRRENIRRLALLARLLADTGAMVLVSSISPYRTSRDQARAAIGNFIEVYVSAPLSACEGRDVKGLYKRARNGEIASFTGIDDPYEPPPHPEVECCTHLETMDKSVARILAALARHEKQRERQSAGNAGGGGD